MEITCRESISFSSLSFFFNMDRLRGGFEKKKSTHSSLRSWNTVRVLVAAKCFLVRRFPAGRSAREFIGTGK